MDVTIDEAAALIGKTARQVRYMINMNRLPARRDGGCKKMNQEANGPS